MDTLSLIVSSEKFLKIINSQFLSSLIGALAGAFAGAMAAHKISENSKEGDNLKSEIRATNAAIMSSYVICNGLLAIKKQNVIEIYDAYKKNKIEFVEKIKQPSKGSIINSEIDLRGISLPHVPIEALTKLTYEKITLIGRPLALVAAISNALYSLGKMIEARDLIIEKYKNPSDNRSHEVKVLFYFGLKLPDGSLSTEYSDSLKGIYQYTNDIIFFSSLLCHDLEKHGNTLLERYINKHGKDIDQINQVQLDDARLDGLIPDSRDYASWLSAFEKHPPKKTKIHFINILFIFFISGSE